MRTWKAGFLYFALVFGAGFAFGVVRQLFVAPRVGEMWAELLEMPLMFVVIVRATRRTVRRLKVPEALGARAGMGLIALSLLVLAELTLVLGLRGLTLAEYVATREPVSGMAYLLMLGVFAAMPSILASIQWSKHGASASRTAQTSH